MAAKPFAKPIKLLKAEVNPHLKKLEKKAEQVKLYRDAQAGLQKALTPVTKLQEWWRGDDDAADAKAAQELAMEIDVDKAAKIFRRHAGFDDDMDQEEFEIFCEAAGIREKLMKNLWKLLDDDGSGSVTLEEFKQALIYLRRAGQWLRFCPTCKYGNSCAFCLEAASCDMCNAKRFCHDHWTEHPGRPNEMREAGRTHLVAGSPAWVQENLLTRPLELVYDAASQTSLPVTVKAKVRRAMRQQQDASAVAIGALAEQRALDEAAQGPEEHLSAVWNPRMSISAGGSLSTSVTWAKPTDV